MQGCSYNLVCLNRLHRICLQVEDLALNFTVNPPSTVFQYKEMELIEGGSDTDVTMDNVELYVEKCTDFYLNSGIFDQVNLPDPRVFELNGMIITFHVPCPK